MQTANGTANSIANRRASPCPTFVFVIRAVESLTLGLTCQLRMGVSGGAVERLLTSIGCVYEGKGGTCFIKVGK